jgi:histone acetyltransferase (RNA polymerase elongator complex component)
VFCDQEIITSGAAEPDLPGQVQAVLEKAVRSPGFERARDPEVAFYGGTFTLMPRQKMERVLEAVAPYLERGQFGGIRVSTRPDAIDTEILRTLRNYGVRTVELGAQSMDDEILALSARGHAAEDTSRAVHLLKRQGFRIGLQLMPGLPGDTPERFRRTVDRAIDLRPDMVRLYPVLVIRGTALERMYDTGIFTPLTLENAIEICAEACERFEAGGIPVIRMGLAGSRRLLEGGGLVAGPWHPAFGFLVRSRIFHRRIDQALECESAQTLRIRVCGRDIPLLRGFRNRGIASIEARCGKSVTEVKTDETLSPGSFRLEPA